MAYEKRRSAFTNDKQRVGLIYVYKLYSILLILINRELARIPFIDYLSSLSIFGFILLFIYRLMDLFESGLMNFWVNNLIPNGADECFASKQKSTARQVPIRLIDLTSAFVIFGIGVGAVVISFLLEIVNFKSQKHFNMKS